MEEEEEEEIVTDQLIKKAMFQFSHTKDETNVPMTRIASSGTKVRGGSREAGGKGLFLFVSLLNV